MVDVAAPATSVLRIGELEIHHEHRRVLMAGREVELNHGGVCHALLHGQFTRAGVLQSAALWGRLGEEYLRGTNSVENTIWRLKENWRRTPRHPGYIKTVVGAGYKIDIHSRQSRMED